ncbi:hypothetical protein MB02_12230 [Croceicoccus estronivorus]|uniref:SDR family oxidoreductase n=1 Tax=Croceicoccus estronivorus TaxID=1172626 RepID=UPI0008296EE8|nr:SDR family oxidoreductase [Croceicoccus estronivorus]OCC23379.1 hypothetical protein MB02_12230 [Croceicoccus estronivorus]
MSARDKVIIVTGAARNIGYHAAETLARRGARVALVGRSATTIEDAAARIGGTATGFAANVADPEDVIDLFARVYDHFGGVDGVVNNAGTAYPNPIEKLDIAEVREQIDINFFAPIIMCRAAIGYLRSRGGGRIVNVSSAAAHTLDAFAHLSIYGSTKLGLERFTDELRHEVRGDNIGVTNFIPGDTATGFGTGWDEARAGEAYKSWLETGTHFGGMMDVADVGEQIAHIFDLPANCTFDSVTMRPVGKRPKVMEADIDLA